MSLFLLSSAEQIEGVVALNCDFSIENICLTKNECLTLFSFLANVRPINKNSQRFPVNTLQNEVRAGIEKEQICIKAVYKRRELVS